MKLIIINNLRQKRKFHVLDREIVKAFTFDSFQFNIYMSFKWTKTGNLVLMGT